MTMPNIGQIMAFEQGELDEEQVVDLFQGLVDSGVAWRLQGSYGRTAAYLISEGLVSAELYRECPDCAGSVRRGIHGVTHEEES